MKKSIDVFKIFFFRLSHIMALDMIQKLWLFLLTTGLELGTEPESNSKTSSINLEIWFSIFYLQTYSVFLIVPIGQLFFHLSVFKYPGSLEFFEEECCPAGIRTEPCPHSICFSYHLYEYHHCRWAVISPFQEMERGFSSSNQTFINFYGIHNFSFPVETGAKPLPQHSTSPGFHWEVSTSLK